MKIYFWIVILCLVAPAFGSINAQNKISDAAKMNESDFKDLIESLLPPLYSWKEKELHSYKEESSPIEYAAASLMYAEDFVDRLKVKTTENSLHMDSILYASLFYISANNEFGNKYAPFFIKHYAERLYDNGYTPLAEIWVNVGAMLCEMKDIYGPVYVELRSLEAALQVDSLPDKSIDTQLKVVDYFRKMHEEEQSPETYSFIPKHYTRAAELAFRAGFYDKADSIKEDALDFLWDRKNPGIINGDISIIREPSSDTFLLKAIESELYLQKGDTVHAIDENETILWRYLDNMIIGNLKAEHFPYYFKSIEFLAERNKFDASNLEHLIYASEYVRDYLVFISSGLSPKLRENFYQSARHTIELINSQLVNFIGEEDVNSTIYNNLLLFKGLDLTTASATLNYPSSKITPNQEALLPFLIDIHYGDIIHESDALKASNFSNWIEVDYQDIIDSLDNESVAIEFFKSVISDTYYAAICYGGMDQPTIIPIATGDFLKESLDNLFYLTSGNLSSLWTKIIEVIPAKFNKIYFAPDGLLYGMAIEYIPIDNGLETSINEVYDIYRVSSTKLISAKCRQPHYKKKSVLLVGNINYGSSNLPGNDYKGIFDDFGRDTKITPLAASRTEISNLYQLFDDNHWQVTKLSGDSVLKNDILDLENRYEIEHISTHGFFINDELMKSKKVNEFHFLDRPTRRFFDQSLTRSGFVVSSANDFFSNGDTEGIVTAYDIAKTDKRGVDLVTISTCQSGQGVISGDGVYGLQRGYKIAGANSIIMSLWDVDDWVSAFFFKTFYTAYLNGFTKREALKMAQKEVKTYIGLMPDNKSRDLAAPKYWAPFILLDGLD